MAVRRAIALRDPGGLADSVSMAALLPLERAVFVLRNMFRFGFPGVASAVERSEATCRQLAVRALRHVDAGRPRFKADRRERFSAMGTARCSIPEHLTHSMRGSRRSACE